LLEVNRTGFSMHMTHFFPNIDTDGIPQQVANKRIMIVGDLMLDRYVIGRVNRISPEAPVPVVDVESEDNRLGGAANVALNVRALGATPLLVGGVGQDVEGDSFRQLMAQHQLDDAGIFNWPNKRTCTKIRVIGNGQQMLRVDKEDTFDIDNLATQELLSHVKTALALGVSGLILQDYDKGTLHPELIQALIQLAQAYNIPTFVDPKHKHFFDFSNCSYFKPNLRELTVGMFGAASKPVSVEALPELVMALRERMPHSNTLITLSEKGMSLFDTTGEMHAFPAHIRRVRDVSGAGDTVISVLASFIAAGYSPEMATYIANLAGGLVCQEVGVVPIDFNQLLQELYAIQRS
jgi:D-glycero-beta-D-manno-heptose-7-phosphate kinase